MKCKAEFKSKKKKKLSFCVYCDSSKFTTFQMRGRIALIKLKRKKL
ncbi:hypothetical protein QG37_08207 [Candidozyma auris]|nr:hypothetical protein QG37_08207 [[Candida] auris]